MRGATRRDFLGVMAGAGALAVGWRGARGEDAAMPPSAPAHELTTIEGSAIERGRQYGQRHSDAIRSFLTEQIEKPFVKKPPTRDELLAAVRKAENYDQFWDVAPQAGA